MKKLSYLLVPLLLFSCSSEPEPSLVHMFCTLNGSSWSATNPRARIFTATVDGDNSKRIDVSGSSFSGITISLGCAALYTENADPVIPVGTYISDVTSNRVSEIAMLDGLSPLANADGIDDESESSVTITTVNTSLKTVSGNFNFKAVGWGEDEITHTALTGVFENVPYVIE